MMAAPDKTKTILAFYLKAIEIHGDRYIIKLINEGKKYLWKI